LEQGIMIAPGPLFSMKGRFQHHIRLNGGVWNPTVESAVRRLGQLCREYRP
jgi:DNA-binding transcriptional MocR family regulator